MAMEDKISIKAFEKYSETYAERVAHEFFQGKSRITGPEILKLPGLAQVNYFVLGEMFKAWKTESEKIKSPYFDYEAPAVKEALDNLMTTLSNHISIPKDSFFPLYRDALTKTLMLILVPYDFYAELISRKGQNPLRISEFKENLKYIKINKAPLERLLVKLEEKGTKEIGGNEAFAVLDHILEEVNFTPDDIDGYFEQLSATVPVNFEMFYENTITSTIARPEPVTTPRTAYQPIEPVTPTINERLAKDQKPTLADNLKKIATLRENLTINQKFMFTKVLFNGDFEHFSSVIENLDQLDSLDNAMKLLEKQLAEWDRESEEFHEFMELVEKRFS